LKLFRSKLACIVLLILFSSLGSAANTSEDSSRITQDQANHKEVKPLLVLISIDGFKPAYLSRGLTPTLNRLAAQGSISSGLIPPFPSLTFPSHYSVVTGMTPDHHGIVNNTMHDPLIPGQTFKLSSREAVANPQWWNEGTPIWVSAAKQGKISSTLFWPGTEAMNQGVQPKDWLAYDPKMNSSQRVDKLLGWLNRQDSVRADFATLYFSEVDTAGHEHGPNSPEVNSAIENVDRAINKFILGLDAQGLSGKTTIVITSDHGMAEVSNDHIIHLKELLKNNPQTSIEWTGPLAGINLNQENVDNVLESLKNNLRCSVGANKKFQINITMEHIEESQI